MPVPEKVARAGLGYEYLYSKWKAEDGKSPEHRKVAQAMMKEIIYRARKKVK